MCRSRVPGTVWVFSGQANAETGCAEKVKRIFTSPRVVMREATAGTIIGRGLEAFRDGLQQWKEGGTLAWRQYTGGAIIQLGRAAVCEERKGACTTRAICCYRGEEQGWHACHFVGEGRRQSFSCTD